MLCLPETYAPTLLQRNANHLRHTTGNWALHSKLDEKELTLAEIAERNLIRPLRMLVTEPIISLLPIYNTCVCMCSSLGLEVQPLTVLDCLLYLLFEAFPIAFHEGRGWSPVVLTLPFLAVLVGVLISGCLQASYQPIFWRKLDAAIAAGKKNISEARLPPMSKDLKELLQRRDADSMKVLGGIFFTTGLFLFGCTASPTYYWILPVIGAAFIGVGFILIFQNAVNYLIDAFTMHAASAQAANAFFRSLFGAGFRESCNSHQ